MSRGNSMVWWKIKITSVTFNDLFSKLRSPKYGKFCNQKEKQMKNDTQEVFIGVFYFHLFCLFSTSMQKTQTHLSTAMKITFQFSSKNHSSFPHHISNIIKICLKAKEIEITTRKCQIRLARTKCCMYPEMPRS